MRIAFIIFFSCFLFACKKDTGGKQHPVFKFKANGVQYEWNGNRVAGDSIGAVIVYEGSFPFYGSYTLKGSDMTSNRFRDFNIAITTDSLLKATTYTYKEQSSYNNTGLLRIGSWNNDRTSLTGDEYVNGMSGDYVSITITKLANNLASGEFSAKLSRVSSRPLEKMIITEGVFENLEIVK